MDVIFSVTTTDSYTLMKNYFCQESQIRRFDELPPEYLLADTAYEFALAWLEDHPTMTFADIDYDWEVLPIN